MYLKKPLQPSQVMALKWKPVALSPHTPQIRGTFLSNSSGARVDVLTTVDSITEQREGKGREKNTSKRKGKKKAHKINFWLYKQFTCSITLPSISTKQEHREKTLIRLPTSNI